MVQQDLPVSSTSASQYLLDKEKERISMLGLEGSGSLSKRPPAWTEPCFSLPSNGNMASGSQPSIEQVCGTIISLELDFVKIRSKFGRDETKQYELIAYKPIAPILQEGPQCGIVALAMAMNTRSSDTTVQNIFEKAKELLFTVQGELFNAHVIPDLCRQFHLTATVHRWSKMTDLIDCLDSHHVCLVPYDSDANHEPCLKKGHRAHWLLVHGYLKEVNSHEYDLVLVQHGKSKHLAAFSLADLFQSNSQLTEADPKRRLATDYCVPADGSLQETLCNLFITI